MKSNTNRITVPEVTPKELIARVEQELDLGYVEAALRTWDFMRGELGRTFEALTLHSYARRSALRDIQSESIRLHAEGNTAAWLVWLIQNKERILSDNQQATYSTIPPYERRFREQPPHSKVWCGPVLFQSSGRWGLWLVDLDQSSPKPRTWGRNDIVVTFRNR
ncbi:MAG: hypothetical protein Q7N87_03440 [Candidatus Uhrbacteria bacterium]|nr:hypothetical protein [Candidatus Uhrbacteria bacterium]